jgi:hypothetical protein
MDAPQKKALELEHKQQMAEQKQAAIAPDNVVTGGNTKGGVPFVADDGSLTAIPPATIWKPATGQSCCH